MYLHADSEFHLAVSQSAPLLALALPRVLCICNDGVLLASRKGVLESGGFNVTACNSDEAARELMLNHTVILMCRSVPSATRITVVPQLRQKVPNAKLILLRRPEPRELGLFDSSIDTALGPEHLLLCLKEFVRKHQ